MKAKEIIKIIENICPERLAYSWDNVGLLCGDKNKDVKKVFVTLDTNINTDTARVTDKFTRIQKCRYDYFTSPNTAWRYKEN